MTQPRQSAGDSEPESGFVAHRDRLPLSAALRRYPLVVLLPVVVLVAAGITLAVRRNPVYSASAQLNVGVTNANSQATPGYAEAAQELASSYSRQAVSRLTAVSVARLTHQPVQTVLSRVSSPAVPDSPTFYVDATGPSATQAVALANATARALQRSADAQQRRTGAGPALSAYRRLQRSANALSDTESTLKAHRATDPASVSLATVRAAELAAQVGALRAQAQSEKYVSAFNSTNETNLEILNPARGASSDRKTYLERYGIIGLVAGIVIGVMLAFLVALIGQRGRRRLA